MSFKPLDTETHVRDRDAAVVEILEFAMDPLDAGGSLPVVTTLARGGG